MATSNPLLTGPNFSVQIPAGFNVVAGDPATGWYRILPLGSSEAQLQIRAMTQSDLLAFLQNLYALSNPNGVLATYAFLGLASVSNLVPLQQTNLPAGPAYLLQFDGFLANGLPIEAVDVVIQGAADGVEVFIVGNPNRMAQIAEPCFQLLTGIQLGQGGGGTVAPPASGNPEVDQRLPVQSGPAPVTKSPEGHRELLRRIEQYQGLKWASDMADFTWRK